LKYVNLFQIKNHNDCQRVKDARYETMKLPKTVK